MSSGATDLGEIAAVTKRFHHDTVDGGDDSVDYYRFTLSEAREVGIGLRRLDHNADVSIEDDAGTVLHRGTNAGTAKEWIRATLLAGT